MSAKEFLLRICWELRPMLPGMAVAAGATLLVLPILLISCKTAWIRDSRFQLASLFFGLTGKGLLCLACAWLKLIFLLTFIIGFQKLVLLNYWMLLLPGVLAALCGDTLSQKFGSLFWLALQTTGLLSVNLICGYILDMTGGLGFILVYAAMGLFLALFSVYLFLIEISGLSASRTIAAEQIWADPAGAKDDEQKSTEK